MTNGFTISAANILGSLWYCWFLAAFGLLSIFIPFADGVCRKDPWNWEYDCADSNVAAKKALLERKPLRHSSNQTLDLSYSRTLFSYGKRRPLAGVFLLPARFCVSGEKNLRKK